MHKKRVLIHSNHCEMFTGFGKHKKNLLAYLYQTGKYEIIELSNGYTWDQAELKLMPWDCYGTLPTDPEIQKEIAIDERRKVNAGYGAEMIDHAIYTLKPDIYLGIEDIWAFTSFFDKPWWNKVNCIIHTTLDSLPILPDAVSSAPKIKNYFVWASFAEKALHKLGHKHIKTVRGTLETKNFYKLQKKEKALLRQRFGLSDEFVIGFVFRNQLRKSVPNLLDGFKLFRQQNSASKAKLLLHTYWNEGWDILKLIKEKEIDQKDILTTYVCKHCSNYEIKPFSTHIANCSYCKTQNSCETSNIKVGVSEKQLNEIYNLMDVYCHPFTSGGQEIPVQEAKLAELITLVTNYSCGEDCCGESSGGLPLDWAEYREPGTQFIKASTLPVSICKQLSYVYNLPQSTRDIIGKRARKFVIDNFSIEVVGKFFENLFDSLPEVNYDFKKEEFDFNPFYEPNESLKDKEWIESLYKNMLGKSDPQGVIHWVQRLSNDLKRQDVLNYFKQISLRENQTKELNKTLEILKDNVADKKIAFVVPENEDEVIIAASLLPSIKKTYPEHNVYFFTKNQYQDLVNSNPYIYKVFNYLPNMDDPLFLEGKANNNQYFDIVFAPHLSIRNNNYIRNGKDKIQFNLYESR